MWLPSPTTQQLCLPDSAMNIHNYPHHYCEWKENDPSIGFTMQSTMSSGNTQLLPFGFPFPDGWSKIRTVTCVPVGRWRVGAGPEDDDARRRQIWQQAAGQTAAGQTGQAGQGLKRQGRALVW